MHRTKFWAGIALILLALLPSIGIILIPGLVFTGTILVVIAIVGGMLVAGSFALTRGWKLWVGLLLILLALLPTLGFVLIPGLVFTGPLLVLAAVFGGYIAVRPRRS